jgi:hypothetical protein
MTTLNEDFHNGGFIVSEAEKTRSRDAITIASSWNLKAGTVLGKLLNATAAPTYAATGGNTGNFTCGTVVPAVGVKPGVYKVEFIAPTVFNVIDPSGALVAEGKTGVAFSAGGLGFTITAGATPAVAGDSATITVAANAANGQYAPYDPTANDGTETAVSILIYAVDATSAASPGVGMSRDAEVNTSELVWGANVTTGGHKTTAYASLATQGVIAR